MVSEKYETDKIIIELSDLSDDKKEVEYLNIDKRAIEIKKSKKYALITVIGLIVILVFLLSRIYKRRIEGNGSE